MNVFGAKRQDFFLRYSICAVPKIGRTECGKSIRDRDRQFCEKNECVFGILGEMHVFLLRGGECGPPGRQVRFRRVSRSDRYLKGLRYCSQVVDCHFETRCYLGCPEVKFGHAGVPGHRFL